MEMEFEPDRPRGFLSPADRKYLLGLTEMTHEQSKRNAEARIRNRVTNGIVDFYLLIRNLERKDRRQIFEKGLDDPAFEYGLVGMLAFSYMGLKETGMDFEHVLAPAITRAEEAYAAEGFGTTVDVTVSLDVQVERREELDSVATRLKAGEPVAPDEFMSVMAGDDEVLDHLDAVMLDMSKGTLGMDDEEYVQRVGAFLGSDPELLDDDLVRIPVEQ
ncbi:hypothetical protein [Haloarchaeobius sp. DYHT-AS-18]|uniref:hypothetical protein n=1 Tax=Haloarchaeobius sp. DYHT-AS-18 TaxID=3446117 RepID=UPI003EBB7B11